MVLVLTCRFVRPSLERSLTEGMTWGSVLSGSIPSDLMSPLGEVMLGRKEVKDTYSHCTEGNKSLYNNNSTSVILIEHSLCISTVLNILLMLFHLIQ